MTAETDTAYRDPNPSIVATLRDEIAHLRREVDRLTAELAKRDAARPRWTLVDLPSNDDLGNIVAAVTLAVIVSWLVFAGCFVSYGPAPFALRWAEVNVVATALWCLAFVRREVTP